MAFSAAESCFPTATGVAVDHAWVSVDLSDGRTTAVPIGWYPRLLNGSPAERGNWRLIDGGKGIHWPDLDEDLSVDGILASRPSSESRAS